MTVNEEGFPEDWESSLRVPPGKNSLFLLEKQKQNHCCLRPPQRRHGLPSPGHSKEKSFTLRLNLPNYSICSQLSQSLQGTQRVFEDGLSWVREQKMLNYLYKWQGRDTLCPFGSRTHHTTSLHGGLTSSFCFAYSNFQMASHFLQSCCL